MTPDYNNMTKAQKFEAIHEFLAAHEADAALIETVDNEIDLIAKKAESARARQAKKKEEGDELRARVADCLTTDPASAADVLEMLNDETGELTVAMIRARLSQLVAQGLASKGTAKGEDGKRTVVYTLPVDESEEG